MIDYQAWVAHLANRGWTTPQIAEEIGYSARHVQRIRYGDRSMVVGRREPRPIDLNPEPDPRLYRDDEVAMIEAMLADGCPYTEIGRTIGRSPRQISRRWPGRGWSAIEGGRFRRLTQRLEDAIDEVWARHLTPAR